MAITPSVVPPPVVGMRPDVIPFRTQICAQAIYLQPIDASLKINPPVADGPCKLLRPTQSAALGPNTCAFVGEVIACDKHLLMMSDGHGGRKPRDKWSLGFVLDCGLPLKFRESYTPVGDPHMGCLENDVRDGAYLEGIARLSFSAFSTRSGIYQEIAGTIEGMQVLDMDPKSPSFGEVRDVEFGSKLNFDPDFFDSQQDTIFASVSVKEFGPLSYGTIPARSSECPEPDYPGLVHTGTDGRIKIVEVKPPQDTGT